MFSAKIIGLLSGALVAWFLSLILLRDKSKKSKKKKTLDILMDDTELRDTIREETKKSFNTKDVYQFIQENNKIFNAFYKFFLIDVEKNRVTMLRANYDKRTGEELAVIQLALMIGGLFGLVFLKYLNAPVFLCLFVFIACLFIRGFFSVKFNSDYKRRLKGFKKEFPDFLDAMKIPIENGMAPDDALRRVGSEWKGVLGEEIRNVITESRNYGGLLYTPLERLAFKLNYPSFTNFIYTFTTTLRTGSDMSPYIGAICNEVRVTSHNEQLEANRKKEGAIIIIVGLTIFLPTVFMLVAPTVIRAIGAF